MSTKQARGTKRTCQSAECDARFYDLNRDPIICPICGTIYELASGPVPTPADEKPGRKPAKADSPPKSESDKDESDEDTLDDIDTGDDGDDIADDSDEFLEEDEEEGGDVSGIVPVKDGGDDEP